MWAMKPPKKDPRKSPAQLVNRNASIPPKIFLYAPTKQVPEEIDVYSRKKKFFVKVNGYEQAVYTPRMIRNRQVEFIDGKPVPDTMSIEVDEDCFFVGEDEQRQEIYCARKRRELLAGPKDSNLVPPTPLRRQEGRLFVAPKRQAEQVIFKPGQRRELISKSPYEQFGSKIVEMPGLNNIWSGPTERKPKIAPELRQPNYLGVAAQPRMVVVPSQGYLYQAPSLQQSSCLSDTLSGWDYVANASQSVSGSVNQMPVSRDYNLQSSSHGNYSSFIGDAPYTVGRPVKPSLNSSAYNSYYSSNRVNPWGPVIDTLYVGSANPSFTSSGYNSGNRHSVNSLDPFAALPTLPPRASVAYGRVEHMGQQSTGKPDDLPLNDQLGRIWTGETKVGFFTEKAPAASDSIENRSFLMGAAVTSRNLEMEAIWAELQPSFESTEMANIPLAATDPVRQLPPLSSNISSSAQRFFPRADARLSEENREGQVYNYP